MDETPATWAELRAATDRLLAGMPRASCAERALEVYLILARFDIGRAERFAAAYRRAHSR